MSIIKRAFLYVARKRGKTILLFAILLIMATFVLTGLSIWKASEAAQLNLRQSLGGKFDIYVDWENSPYVVKEIIKDNEFDEETGKTSNSFLIYSTVQLTPEDIDSINSVPGVIYSSARYDVLARFDNLSLFPGTVSVAENLQHRTKVFGVCGTETDELFTTGTLTLTEGRHITSEDQSVAIISGIWQKKMSCTLGTISQPIFTTPKMMILPGKKCACRLSDCLPPM